MNRPVYSVAGLVHCIKGTLDKEAALQGILVKGEISNFTNHRSGHWYFTLKDHKAKISCVMFASYASRCKIMPKEGMKVIVNASVSLYEAGGATQLYVTGMQQDGLGDLFLQLEAVKEKMRAEGCFDAALKKPLPAYPMNIAIITAKTGAAVQDMLTTISRRWPLSEVHVYPSLVQGKAAAANIIENLHRADQAGHDVILLARGGGAIEDLWCFNEESVARTVLQMKTVIVTGVGHETDTTLVDYVSDARAATPTAAAELITPDKIEVSAALQKQKSHLQQLMQQRLYASRQSLLQLQHHRYFQDPLSFIQKDQMTLAMHIQSLGKVERMTMQRRSALHEASHALGAAARSITGLSDKRVDSARHALLFQMEQFLKLQQKEFENRIALLDAFSPLKILKRGYTLVYQEEHLVKNINDVKLHEDVTIRMQDGLFKACVIDKEELT